MLLLIGAIAMSLVVAQEFTTEWEPGEQPVKVIEEEPGFTTGMMSVGSSAWKCSQCAKENKKSSVYIGSSWSTLMNSTSFYDKEGRYHYHDPNITTTGYRCSNGHEWSIDTGGSQCTFKHDEQEEPEEPDEPTEEDPGSITNSWVLDDGAMADMTIGTTTFALEWERINEFTVQDPDGPHVVFRLPEGMDDTYWKGVDIHNLCLWPIEAEAHNHPPIYLIDQCGP